MDMSVRYRMTMIAALALMLTLSFAMQSVSQDSCADSGICGEGITYDLTDGTLTITYVEGTGVMDDYSNDSPWFEDRGSITSIDASSRG